MDLNLPESKRSKKRHDDAIALADAHLRVAKEGGELETEAISPNPGR